MGRYNHGHSEWKVLSLSTHALEELQLFDVQRADILHGYPMPTCNNNQ